MSKHTEIVISRKTLKSCVNRDGNLVLIIDFDATQDENFPKGDEIFSRTKKDDMPENYNNDICLVKNRHMVYVNDEPFALKDAQYRTVKILYEQPGHKVYYKMFAKLYSDENTNDPKRCNDVVNSAMRHSNIYFLKNNIPLMIKRDESDIVLVKTS